MGVFMSLIIIMFLFSRFMHKRTGFFIAITFGWSGVLYCLSLLYTNLASLLVTYQVKV